MAAVPPYNSRCCRSIVADVEEIGHIEKWVRSVKFMVDKEHMFWYGKQREQATLDKAAWLNLHRERRRAWLFQTEV
jgi:hypothetical protein